MNALDPTTTATVTIRDLRVTTMLVHKRLESCNSGAAELTICYTFFYFFVFVFHSYVLHPNDLVCKITRGKEIEREKRWWRKNDLLSSWSVQSHGILLWCDSHSSTAVTQILLISSLLVFMPLVTSNTLYRKRFTAVGRSQKIFSKKYSVWCACKDSSYFYRVIFIIFTFVKTHGAIKPYTKGLCSPDTFKLQNSHKK